MKINIFVDHYNHRHQYQRLKDFKPASVEVVCDPEYQSGGSEESVHELSISVTDFWVRKQSLNFSRQTAALFCDPVVRWCQLCARSECPD
ncbi:hypothetical protein [Litoreibacter halocynthiae]|uniref:hypothetical protein n=1 Tax=Litoreibacter halocynthiae TaxID=1242689 RepID=UPI00248FA0BE|nr:hypothetical protein [Litoreibacter halocynthiae]